MPIRNDLENDDYGLLSFKLEGDRGDFAAEASASRQDPSTMTPPESAEEVLTEEITVPKATGNTVGASSYDRRFDFRSQILFQRHGRAQRLLRFAAFAATALAPLSLFLRLGGLDAGWTWLIFALLLCFAAVAFILQRSLAKTWRHTLDSCSLLFRRHGLELILPAEHSKDFHFPQGLSVGANSGNDSEFTSSIQGDYLHVLLPYDSLLDQAYHTQERTMLLTIDAVQGDRLITIRVPDSSLDRTSRNLLETEIFNRAGRSLRSIHD